MRRLEEDVEQLTLTVSQMGVTAQDSESNTVGLTRSVRTNYNKIDATSMAFPEWPGHGQSSTSATLPPCDELRNCDMDTI